MKTLVTVSLLCLFLGASAVADDLYMVRITGSGDAAALRDIKTDVLMSVTDGYIVLTTSTQAALLRQSGLTHTLLASGIRRDQLALDGRFDRKNAETFEVLYQDGQVRLLLADPGRVSLADERVELIPLPDMPIKVQFRPPSTGAVPDLSAAALDDIYMVMDRVLQDSLESYVLTLQDFYRRVAGTASNYAARDYIAAKFVEFGYDSVSIDPFVGSQLWSRVPCQCYNVIAYKPGTTFPNRHIIIGGHFDAVPDCPGADDNATGTAAVMECARVLAETDTKLSIVFVAFDSEESGLFGAYHYLSEAREREEDILLMINADMIAHHVNSDRADLYTGVEDVYARIWDQIANANVGIDADLSTGAASDHWPFQQAGYDVIFVQEKIFSNVYHTPRDSTTYVDFEYMTRMVKATAATIFSVDQYPPPIRITSIQEPGDGQSQLVNWQPVDPTAVAYFQVSYFSTSTPLDVTTVVLPSTESSLLVEGLTEGQEYGFFVHAYNDLDQTSLAYDVSYATPSSIPQAPWRITVMPLHNAINVSWAAVNTELDFAHCSIVRDGEIVGESMDSFFIDDDPSLLDEMHYYYVVASDNEGNTSDTVGTEPIWGKAAMLEPGRILAINRSSIRPVDFVDEVETGVFMREALEGYNFDYYSDTVATTCRVDCVKLDLNDLVDYGVVVIGAEAAIWEDLAEHPMFGGIMDTLAYYLSIGGRVVIFGRFGDLGVLKTIDYEATGEPYDNGYKNTFHIDLRVQTPTYWDNDSTFVSADLVAAYPTIDTYPELPWDSLATLAHAQSQAPIITEINAIPCASFVQLTSTQPEVIYTYDSRFNDPVSDDQPVGWRYFGPDYCYVFFEIPLSLFERDAAIAALRQAVDEVVAGVPEEGGTPVDPPDDVLPASFTLKQNYPNPFNPFTRIQYTVSRTAHVEISIYNILGQKVATIVDDTRLAGDHFVDWRGADDSGDPVSSGIYMYRLKAGGVTESKKMLLIK